MSTIEEPLVRVSGLLRRVRRADGRRIALTVGIVAVAGVGAVLGVISAGYGSWAIGVAIVVLMLGVAAIDLSLIPTLAVPATLVVARVGGVLTVSDVLLAAATMIGLLMLRGRGALALQPLIWAGLVYLGLIVPTLILNRYSADIVEWVHEIFLVLGSMVVGFVVGREGKATLALTLYVVACSVIGVAAMLYGLAGAASDGGSFQAVYLWGLHKNDIGGMLAVALVIAYARPVWVAWPRWFSWTVVVLCGLGVLASQSRQGMVGALVGILIISLRPRVRDGKRAKLIWLITIPVLWFVIAQVNAQLASNNAFNSAHTRLTWFADSFTIWRTSPIFGVGLRWWYTSRFDVSFQPPNAELEVLTSGGIVGLFGFLMMFAAAVWLLSKLNPVYGTVGVAVVMTRFTQAQFDLYWIAGEASLLWIIAGICYGVMVRDRSLGLDRQPHPVTPVLTLIRGGLWR